MLLRFAPHIGSRGKLSPSAHYSPQPAQTVGRMASPDKLGADDIRPPPAPPDRGSTEKGNMPAIAIRRAGNSRPCPPRVKFRDVFGNRIALPPPMNWLSPCRTTSYLLNSRRQRSPATVPGRAVGSWPPVGRGRTTRRDLAAGAPRPITRLTPPHSQVKSLVAAAPPALPIISVCGEGRLLRPPTGSIADKVLIGVPPPGVSSPGDESVEPSPRPD